MMVVHVIMPRAVEEPAAPEAAVATAAVPTAVEPEVIKKGKTDKPEKEEGKA
jgi:hypothetical protein